MTSLRKTFKLNNTGVICLVGAGGKTSLMFALARELSGTGDVVLTTTTTKIMKPRPDQSPNVIVTPASGDLIHEIMTCIGDRKHITIATGYVKNTLKLVGFEPHTICNLWNTGLFHWIIIEADGAAGRPLKAPATYEPVIPNCTSKVIALVGLDAVGKPLNDKFVFRPQHYSQVTGLPMGMPVTEETIAKALFHEKGILKDCPAGSDQYIFFNKADEQVLLDTGRKCANILLNSKLKPANLKGIAIGAIKKNPHALEWYPINSIL